jgi:hypothetical protein
MAKMISEVNLFLILPIRITKSEEADILLTPNLVYQDEVFILFDRILGNPILDCS